MEGETKEPQPVLAIGEMGRGGGTCVQGLRKVGGWGGGWRDLLSTCEDS